jgi:protoporphyrinogen oxidase
MIASAPVLVVGGGVPGMVYALYLANTGKRKVILVEQQSKLGGLFSSVKTPFGPVDQGIHILYETGERQIDALIRKTLPEAEWHTLTGVRKDIAGNYFRGVLNTGSIFPDIRLLPSDLVSRLLGSFMQSLPNAVPGFSDSASLLDYFGRRFGKPIANEVFVPIAQKVWQRAPEYVSAWAARMVYMTRIVMSDKAVAETLKKSPIVDQLVAWPDQLSLPANRLSNSLIGLYPKRFGMSTFLDSLENALVAASVRILKNCSVVSLDKQDGDRAIQSVRLQTSDGTLAIEPSAIVWTSPPPSLAKLLDIRLPSPPDTPLATRTVLLYLREPPVMGPLYYFYCYDSEFRTFRVSSPAAYCPSAETANGYPLMVELHYAPGSAPDEKAALNTAINEVSRMKIVNHDADVSAHWVAPGVGAFPVPTLANMSAIEDSFKQINAHAPANLHVVCPDISRGSFYLADALRAGFSVVDALARV